MSSLPNALSGHRRRELNPLIVMGIHLGGVLTTMALLASSVLSSRPTTTLFFEIVGQDPSLKVHLFKNLLIHAGISIVLWGLLAILGQSLWRRRQQPTRLIRRTQGSIYVEFLAVIPVFLLLTMGLLQLGFVNIGAALSQMAGYQAARVAWVWQPEININQPFSQTNVTHDAVADRARIAAALVMTPVVPGDYLTPPGGSAEFESLRRSMMSRFTLSPELWEGLGNGQIIFDQKSSFVRGLDSTNLPVRAFRKFSFSYGATELNSYGQHVLVESGDIVVRFRFFQLMAVPLVNHIFGERVSPPSGPDGYYKIWDIEYRLPAQRHGANRRIPGV